MTALENPVAQLFDDTALVEKIRRRLPHLFHYAERESSRAGKVGMEVGSLRERILVALLIYKFGRDAVETQLPITEHEVDVRVKGHSISIKTVTTKSTKKVGTVKAIWTVDAQRAREFVSNFQPSTDYLVAHLVWGRTGGLYFIPQRVQARVFSDLGRERYLKLPKPGTNPRGVEISKTAVHALVDDAETRRISITWQRPAGEYDPYERWVEYWRLD